MVRECTEELLLEEVKDHKMTVLLDQGVYRHLVFKTPGDSNAWFEIVTWPGSLTINGDYGTWTFARTTDMFDFFGHRTINPGYWAEKILSEDRHGAHEAFSSEVFEAKVKEWFDRYDEWESEEQKEDCWNEILDHVLSQSDNAHAAYSAASDFEHDSFDYKSDFNFDDFFEVDCNAYNFRYIWCLYAIVWAIDKYDEHKSGRPLVRDSV